MSRKKLKLTRAVVNAAQPKDRRFFIADYTQGFTLKVLPSGKKWFCYNRKNICDVDTLSVDEARRYCAEQNKAKLVRELGLSASSEPIKPTKAKPRQAPKAAEPTQGVTKSLRAVFFQTLVQQWLDSHVFDNGDEEKDEFERRRAKGILKNNFENLNIYPISQVNKEIVLQTLQELIDSGRIDAAQRGKRVLVKFFKDLANRNIINSKLGIEVDKMQISSKYKKINILR